MGVEAGIRRTGCCGMAGAFGYEKRKRPLRGRRCRGRTGAAAASAESDDDELIIADGFSCQEQIRQQTDRVALHTAQVLQLAIHGDRETALAAS